MCISSYPESWHTNYFTHRQSLVDDTGIRYSVENFGLLCTQCMNSFFSGSSSRCLTSHYIINLLEIRIDLPVGPPDK